STRCYATSCLSNLGRVLVEAPLPRRDGKLVAGNLVLEGIESAPPVRPHSHTSLTCLFYRGCLTLVQNYDRHHFTPDGAQALMDVTVQQLRETIERRGLGTSSLPPKDGMPRTFTQPLTTTAVGGAP